MLKTLFRTYWFKNDPKYAVFKREIIDKRMKWPSKTYNDPLSKEHSLRSICPNTGKQLDPIFSLTNYIRKRSDVNLAPHSVAYVAYHSVKNGILDQELWELLEYYMLQQLHNLTDRMTFGCVYGFVSSGYGKLANIESLLKEFYIKSLPELTPFECFEMLDCAAQTTRTDYSLQVILTNDIVPRYNELWKHGKFVHIPSYLLKLMKNLIALEIWDTALWHKVTGILHRKSQRYVKTWQPLYETLLALESSGFTEKTGVPIDELTAKYRGFWESNKDFQWLYNLAEGRPYTVHELIAQAKDTPSSLTWQEAEHYIQHNLPAWYWQSTDEPDIDDLLREYKSLKKYMK